MYIKGFDENLCCRGMQFEVGKTYETPYPDDQLELCSETVIHFCDNLQNVHTYYEVTENNRYCEVQPLGGIVKCDDKYGTNKIKIVREIVGDELKHLKGMDRGNTGIFNTGNRNTGNWNTGNRNTGNWNTGNWNTGDRNTGNCNTGNCNTGDRNTGNCNTGNCNTGNWNTGNWNTGVFNSCNRSTGVFNTKEQTIMIFNKDSGMTWEEFYISKYYDAIFSSSFVLTEWIWYTEEEMKDSPIRQCIRGYLKSYTFEEACKNWWDGMSEKNREIIKDMPNFDSEIFKEITGIEV